MTYHLGVDLGTTWTAAAVRRGDVLSVATLGNRTPEIPSVVFLPEEGEPLVGEAAERRAAEDPSRVAREFKRLLGDPVPLLLGGVPWSAQALTAKLLRAVVDRVSEREGGPPAGVTVTHPANWGPFKHELLAQALQMAEVPRARTLSEPEAAAVHYASTERVAVGEVLAVYDLGGGTFDAAVLRKTDTGFAVLGRPQGIEHLGGIDFDEAVFAHVRGTLGPALLDLDLDDPAVLRGLARLRRDCVEAKEALSGDTVATVPVVLPTVQTEVRLTRAEFEALVEPALQETLAALRRTLESADVQPEQLRTAVLVGGSSRIPLVSQMVSGALGRPVSLDAHPKHAVALGAALAGSDSGTAPAGADQVGEARREDRRAPGEPRDAPRVPRPALVGLASTLGVAALVALAVALWPGGDAPATGGEEQASQGLPAAGEPLPDDVLVHAEFTNDQIDIVRRPATPGSPSEYVVGQIAVGDKLPVLSPDRRSLLYLREGSGTGGEPALHVAAVDGSIDLVLATGVGADSRPSFSPDGSRIAIERRDPETGQSDIWLAAVDTSGPAPVLTDYQNLTRDGATDGDPAWSPDGTRIAYWKRDVSQDLVVQDLRTGGTTPVTSTPDVDEVDPAWSPDGTRLAFSRQSGPATARSGSLHEVPVDGGAEPRLLFERPGLFANDPSYSPDGSRVAFQTEQREDGAIVSARIWTVAPDTGEVQEIAENPIWLGHVAW